MCVVSGCRKNSEKETTVPFQPSCDKPVYRHECYQPRQVNPKFLPGTFRIVLQKIRSLLSKHAGIPVYFQELVIISVRA